MLTHPKGFTSPYPPLFNTCAVQYERLSLHVTFVWDVDYPLYRQMHA